jgi:hypothetical protein
MWRVSRRSLLRALASLLPSSSLSAQILQFSGATLSSGLPAGVTLQAIDGETMTSPTTMSLNYFSRNGYSAAASAGWDATTFYPIGIGPSGPGSGGNTAADVAAILATKANFYDTVDSNANSGAITNQAPWLWQNYLSNGTIATPNNGLAVCYTLDEPSSMSDWQTGIQAMPSSTSNGHFFFINWTWNFIAFGGSSPIGSSSAVLATITNNANSVGIHIGCTSIDNYWISDFLSNAGNAVNLGQAIYNPSMTADQGARGCYYGDVVDALRTYLNQGASGPDSGFTFGNPFNRSPPSPIPIHLWIENGDPDGSVATGVPIPAAGMNWAVWASIVHGMRAYTWFNFDSVIGSASPLYNVGNSAAYSAQIAQATSTNGLVTSMAPVINSPIALGFASVSPAAFMTNQRSTSFATGGIEILVKWYTGPARANYGPANISYNPGFFIIATTRESRNAINISATFTVARGTLATVINEGRTIPIVGGQFTDTFALGSTVHIYQIS